MTTRRLRKGIWWLFALLAGVVFLVTTTYLSSPAQPVQALPTRWGDFTPETQPTPVPVTGALIELRVIFPDTWPWGELHWQDLWTAVQWQDADGAWHTVAGWQGTLEDITLGEQVVGWKRWWVDKKNLGAGPFRWVLYRDYGGPALATSEPFDLPATLGTVVMVEVAPTP